MASILPPLSSDDEVVRRLRCPKSDSPRHHDKAHHLQFMMRGMRFQPQLLAQWVDKAFGIPFIQVPPRRLHPGLGTDPSSWRYHIALNSLVKA
eukprot:6207412-Pleurochrysis_carterae.AAC.6